MLIHQRSHLQMERLYSLSSGTDTDQYNAQQKSMGFSISIPIGPGAVGASISASSSHTKSNYASVNEQAGIFAGEWFPSQRSWQR